MPDKHCFGAALSCRRGRSFRASRWSIPETNVEVPNQLRAMKSSRELTRKTQKSFELRIPRISRMERLWSRLWFRSASGTDALQLLWHLQQRGTRVDLCEMILYPCYQWRTYSCFSSQSFWKAESLRKGSQIGSSLRRARVTGAGS